HIFFSSRRRHTRSKRDWSSDVCSSDLWPAASGRGRRVSRSPHTDDWRGSGDPATNTTRKYAVRQCRQTVPPESYSPESSISWKRSEERRVGKECGTG